MYVTHHRITTGGQISLKFSKQGSSISALVPGQDDLVYRACIEEHLEYLRIWFARVQTRAWKWANTFGASRPNKIFLITGQTLSNEFAIAHIQEDNSEIEITLEPKLEVSQTIEISPSIGYHVSRAKASAGFSEYRPASSNVSRLYSLFFEVIESTPIHFISPDHKLTYRISDAFKYVTKPCF